MATFVERQSALDPQLEPPLDQRFEGAVALEQNKVGDAVLRRWEALRLSSRVSGTPGQSPQRSPVAGVRYRGVIVIFRLPLR